MYQLVPNLTQEEECSLFYAKKHGAHQWTVDGIRFKTLKSSTLLGDLATYHDLCLVIQSRPRCLVTKGWSRSLPGSFRDQAFLLLAGPKSLASGSCKFRNLKQPALESDKIQCNVGVHEWVLVCKSGIAIHDCGLLGQQPFSFTPS